MSASLIKTLSTAALGLALAAGAAAAADYVILDSNAEGIEPGIVVDGAADVNLPEGAELVLITPSGDTLVVAGPYSGPLTAAAEASEGSGSALEIMTTTRGGDTTVLGAVRAPQIDGGAVKE